MWRICSGALLRVTYVEIVCRSFLLLASHVQVFASCSVDRTIKLWDARRGKGAVATLAYHNSDVNVIAWNPKRAFFLASGGDDGVLNVMDLRTMKYVDCKDNVFLRSCSRAGMWMRSRCTRLTGTKPLSPVSNGTHTTMQAWPLHRTTIR